MTYPASATNRYFHRVRRYRLSDGERFVTVVDAANVPAYYPTALALSRRSRGLSAETLAAEAGDLVHVGLWAERERIDLNARLEAGEYFGPVEVDTLAEACGLRTGALRRITAHAITEVRRNASFSRSDVVINALKSRRLTTALRYFEFVGKMSEAWLQKRAPDLARRIAERTEMAELIKAYRPRMRSSRIRSAIKAGDLARVTAFVTTGNPHDIWPVEALARRNWALLNILVASGLRQGEARQLKPEDVDLVACEMRIERRHDDPDDPRLIEANTKTFDRTIPFGPAVAQILEEYLLGAGSDAAEKRGSAFIFLSHDNRTHGTPLSARTVQKVVTELGQHLDIDGLTPHHLRHGWIQNLADWAITTGLEAAEFERFANNLGGWSYISKMAAEYRGDHLTEAAFKAGLKVQGERS